MRLKRLEIFGFKSFGRKVTLDFISQITAVVGPNGSGKSNVAEAIRFVLGEQSMKSMRGKRGEDMIFNGSQSASRANRASVTIVFDNTQREFPLDFDEVSVTREVFRDGSNQYFINGSVARLRDIFELLAAVHIGASGHHMISQGEADRILSANPKERRSMLEDALGLKAYQYKREESERRLTKTEENMREVESLRREIAPHLRFLKKQMEKMEEAKTLRDKLVGLYREYLKREEIYLTESRALLAGKLSEPAAKLADLNIKIERAREQLAAESAGDSMSHELLAVEAKLRDARNRRDGAARSLGKVDGMIEFEERRLKKREEQLARQEDIAMHLGEVEHVSRELEALFEGMEGNNELDKWRWIAYRARDMVREFIGMKKQSAGQQAITDEDRRELEGLRAERVIHEEELRKIDAEYAIFEENYARVKNAIDTEKERSRDTERALFTMMQERGELQHAVERIHSEEERIVRDTQRLNEELSEAGILLGRAVLDHSSVVVDIAEVMGEDRLRQETRRREIERGKLRLEDLGGAGGDDVEKEFAETVERDAFLARETEDLIRTQESLRALIEELNVKLNTEFRDGVGRINKQFSEFFRLMFGGGVAELMVVKIEKRKRRDTDIDLSDIPGGAVPDEEEGEDEEGVDVSVSLPHKKIKGLQMLSGGERALTSIALLFAISQVNPPPFMVLDETDAALDEANSRKYGDMIEQLARHSQLMVITHNRETMSRATTLYGVTMGSDAVSKTLSISFDEAALTAK
ncbi:MAG TPA: AAA family ATPase [Candidatus Paceibacterota bacterium]|nr:AAA family ATPase [Candidatus Paceibacterota bacterium]